MLHQTNITAAPRRGRPLCLPSINDNDDCKGVCACPPFGWKNVPSPEPSCMGVVPKTPVGRKTRPLRFSIFVLMVLLLTTLTPKNTAAYWPVTVENNLPVSVTRDTIEADCSVFPFTDNSTIVIFFEQYYGNVYQVIDRYGQLTYFPRRYLTPGNVNYNVWPAHAVLDETGGVFTAWHTTSTSMGIYAQRIDSLGNLMWGDLGIEISTFHEFDFDICADGEGGMYLAAGVDDADGTLWIQKIEGDGSLPWGPAGVNISPYPNMGAHLPKIVHDGSGGCFVLWVDCRSSSQGAVYLQRVDSSGNPLWAGDLYIRDDQWYHYLVYDGFGGCIVHTGYGSNNWAWRVDGGGNILWENSQVSQYVSTKIFRGEPGYFYFGFTYGSDIYCQRMDIDGNLLWTHLPDDWGLLVWDCPGDRYLSSGRNWCFRYPYFYSIWSNEEEITEKNYVTIQYVDTLGNLMLPERGIDITSKEAPISIQYQETYITTDSSGMACVYVPRWGGIYDINVEAKHLNWDGSLGGPNAPIENVTISVSGSDIVLTWPAMASSAEYHIYKSPVPYSFPAEPDTSVTDTTFTDTGAVNAGTGYYRVTWELW